MLLSPSKAPLVRASVWAVVYAAITSWLIWFNGGPATIDTLVLVVLAAATVLVSQEGLDGMLFKRGISGWSRGDRGVFAYQMGLVWAMPLALGGAWAETSGAWHLLVWGMAGLFFGGFMAASPPKTDPHELAQHYETDAGIGSTVPGWLFYGIPVFGIGLVMWAAMYAAPPANELFFIWFFLLITLSHLAPYQPRAPFFRSPKVYGLALIMGAIALNYSSTSSTSA